MAKSQDHKELDIETPNIYCKEMEMNEHYIQTKDSVEEWILIHRKKEWKDQIESVAFCSLVYRTCHDKEKFLLIVKIVTWAFLLDDYLDKKPEQVEHFLKVFEAKRALTNNYLELMYEETFTQLEMTSLNYNQKLRIMLSLVKIVGSYGISGNMRKNTMKLTLNVFKNLRYADSFVDAIYVFAEWYLEIDMSPFWNIRLFQKFHERMADHAQAVNDIYSYKKELKNENNINYSYMSILMADLNISFEESLNICVERVGILEKELDDLVKELGELSFKVSKVYIDEVIDIIHGNHYWSKTCGRYKLKEES